MITRVPPVALVAIGGALGSLARVALIDACMTRLDPWMTTTAINLAGSMAAGFIWMRLAARHDGPGRTNRLAWSALLITGFMGGFTTFSGFGLFTSELAGASRLNAAITNLWVSLVIAIFGAFAGAMLAKPALRRPNP